MIGKRFVKKASAAVLYAVISVNSVWAHTMPKGNEASTEAIQEEIMTDSTKFVMHNKQKFIIRWKFYIPEDIALQKILAGRLFGDSTTTFSDAFRKYIDGFDKVYDKLPKEIYGNNIVSIGCNNKVSAAYYDDVVTYLYYVTRTISNPLNDSGNDLPKEKRGYLTYDKKKKKVLTVADVLNPETIKAKGLDGTSTDLEIKENGELVCYSMSGSNKVVSDKFPLTTANLSVFTEDIKGMIADKASDGGKNNKPLDIKPFEIVEQMPAFPGGDVALMAWLSKNVKYPEIAEENGVQGLVIVRFVVERDGSITNVSIVRSVDPSLDREALRVVKSMPKWIPGKQDGRPVPVWFTLPVTFRLQ